jgi:hypothetical protein
MIMKQTAVEWLFEQLDISQGYESAIKIFDQAKEMEKEQIINANNRGWKVARESIYELGEKYYNETYVIENRDTQ